MSSSYLLLDIGNGRKLEQFGAAVLDRPCPAAEGIEPASPAIWRDADVALPSRAKNPPRLAEPWCVSFPLLEKSSMKTSRVETSPEQRLHFQLKLTPFGHVGVFPEQLVQWRWLYNVASQHCSTDNPNPDVAVQSARLKAINLFAYTGGSTMALAMGGAEVTHVDASAPSVAWARSNAQLNQLAERPIRWIVEDARKFVQREIRRGNNYDIVVLDPPSYGHGPSGKAWDLAAEWEELLSGCLQLLKNSQHARLLWTGHSDSPTTEQIIECISLSHKRSWQIDVGRSRLTDAAGRTLDAGYFVRAKAE